jgi:methylmalonyl-CoA mutase
VQAALAALDPPRGEGGNLLEPAVEGARAARQRRRDQDAMEKVFGRHRAQGEDAGRRLWRGL